MKRRDKRQHASEAANLTWAEGFERDADLQAQLPAEFNILVQRFCRAQCLSVELLWLLLGGCFGFGLVDDILG